MSGTHPRREGFSRSTARASGLDIDDIQENEEDLTQVNRAIPDNTRSDEECEEAQVVELENVNGQNRDMDLRDDDSQGRVIDLCNEAGQERVVDLEDEDGQNRRFDVRDEDTPGIVIDLCNEAEEDRVVDLRDEAGRPHTSPDVPLSGGSHLVRRNSPQPSTSGTNRSVINNLISYITVDSSDEEDTEVRSPPRKNRKIDLATEGSSNKSDDESSICTICYESFTNFGDHRLCCLKCGHVFGRTCIEKWLKQRGRCPQCNCKAAKKEIRILFVKQLVAIDDTIIEAAKEEVEKSQAMCSRLKLECSKMNITINLQNQQIFGLEKTVEQYKRQLACTETRNPNTACVQGSNVSNLYVEPFGRTALGLFHKNKFAVKEGGCRVGAYSKTLNMLVVSQQIKNSLFPNGCGGIQKFNLEEMRASTTSPIHQKQIRDLAFSSNMHDLLLSVSLDKKAILFSVSGNVAVKTFEEDSPLWCCAWDTVHQNQFYAGTANGTIVSYDIRSPREKLSTLTVPTSEKSPICSMKSIPPAYQSSSFSSTGLLIQKLNSIWFCEDRGVEPRYHQLPFEGSFVNVDFEPVSRHFLVSSRPSVRASTRYACHIVSEFTQYYSEPLQGTVISSNNLFTYKGGNQESKKLCRSKIFSPMEGYVYVAANDIPNSVKIWDITLPGGGTNILTGVDETVLDFVYGELNAYSYLGLISDKKISVVELSGFRKHTLPNATVTSASASAPT